jgi:hypothetical protein
MIFLQFPEQTWFVIEKLKLFYIYYNYQNNLLIESMHRFIIGPIYLSSLASFRFHPHSILVTRVTSLFLYSQFLRIIQETSAVQSLLTSLFFGDQNDIRTEWSRSLENGLHLKTIGKCEKPQEKSI